VEKFTFLYPGLLNFWNDFGCMRLLKVSSVPRVDLLFARVAEVLLFP